jgi:outer membrane murein-binding lipoprotein Lpp
MFISRAEKDKIENRLLTLEARVDILARSLNALHDKKSAKAERDKALANLKTHEINEKAKEQLRRREYAKAYYYRKKAKKAAANSTTAN